MEDVIRRDGAYFRNRNGWFQSFMMTGVMRGQHQQMIAAMRESERRIEAIHKLLQTHLVLHAYWLEKHRFPETLDELVPGFLRELPQDSFTARSLLYRPLADSYLLYSVGADGLDGGGVKKDMQGNRVDLLLEASD